MAEIKQKDGEFLQSLGGGLEPGEGWKILQRNGDVLLLLPARTSAIRAGARLYSPQRTLAKVATAAFLKSPLWRVLPGFGWKWDPGSPLETLMKAAGSRVGAILLGNPGPDGRRALVLTDEDDPQVFKLGVGPVAAKLVSREREFLSANGGQSQTVPQLTLEEDGENWAAFGIPYFDEGAEVTFDEISSLLQTWLEKNPRPMSELPGWRKLSDSKAPEAKVIAEACRDFLLRPSMVHGDFARWNVRRKKTGEIILIDWENGRTGDVPCWDAVHFAFQRAALVSRLESAAIESEVKKAMGEGELAKLIEASGWAGHEDLLFKSYLLGMATEERHVSALLGADCGKMAKG